MNAQLSCKQGIDVAVRDRPQADAHAYAQAHGDGSEWHARASADVVVRQLGRLLAPPALGDL